MKKERCIRGIAGAFVFVSLLLGVWVSKYALFFTAFVGLNLFQSAFTRFCPMEKLLEKIKLCGNEKHPGRLY
jgi:hypothetical protein